MANDELKNLQQRRVEQKALLDEMLKGKTEEERLIVKQQQNYKAVLNVLKEINEQVKEIQSDNKIAVDNLIQQESKLKGLTGIQASLVNLDRQRITAQQTLGSDTQDAINSIASMNQELLAMSAEDSIGRELQKNSINEQISSLRESGNVSEEILSNLIQQKDIAYKMSGLTEKQQKFLNKQLEVYEGIKDAIGGVLETASLLTSTMGGMIGISLIGLGKIATAAGEVRSKLGGMGDAGTTFISFFDDNAVENAKSLAGQFGSMNNVSTELQVSTSLISTNMGIGGDEAASLIGSLSRGAASTKELSLDMIKSVQATAKLRGVIPSKVLKDLAGASKEFALYSKQGKLNLQQSAIAAGELGVDLSVLTGASAALLDFETSINAELELQALTGKTINLERARQLALAEDDIGAMQEVARQLGGIAGWEAMGRWEKNQAANLLGIQADELEKIIYNQKEVATSGSMINESFSAVGETINAGMNKYLGVGLQGLGGMVIAAGQLNGGFSAFGGSLKGAITGTAQILKNLLGMVAGPVLNGIKVVASSLSDSKLGRGIKSIKDKLLEGVGSKPQVPGADAAAGADKVSKGKGIGEQLKGLASGLKAMGNTKVFIGALNLIPTGLGFVAILPGLPGMLGVSLLGVNAGIGLKSLGVGLKAFGNTQVSLGALNLALAAVGFVAILPGLPGMLGVSLLGVNAGIGLKSLGVGLKAFGNTQVSLGALNLALAAVGFALMTVGVIGLAGIALLGVAAGAGLTALAGGLAAFGASAAVTIIGIGLLALLGLAMIPLTYALSLLAPLVESIGTAIATMMVGIGQGISMIVTSLGDLLVKVLPLMNLEAAAGIFAVAGAFFTLAGALTAVGVAGIFALPGLLAIQATGAVAGVVGGVIDGMFGGDDETTKGGGDNMDALLNEIKGLRTDLNSGKVAVYIDGKKVTGTVASVSSRATSNTYNR